MTRSGRHSFKPKRLAYETTNFSVTESNYYAALATHDKFDTNEHTHSSGSNVHFEITAVGAGVEGGFDHTSDLHVMNYTQAMQTKGNLILCMVMLCLLYAYLS